MIATSAANRALRPLLDGVTDYHCTNMGMNVQLCVRMDHPTQCTCGIASRPPSGAEHSLTAVWPWAQAFYQALAAPQPTRATSTGTAMASPARASRGAVIDSA